MQIAARGDGIRRTLAEDGRSQLRATERLRTRTSAINGRYCHSGCWTSFRRTDCEGVILLVEFLSGLEGLMLQRCHAHPNETFLKWKDQEIAWGDFVDHIYAMAAGFWDAGIRTGERGALMMDNCPEFLYTYYAIVFMGVGAVPLNRAQRGDALAYILNDSGASAIVIDEGLLTYFNNIRERVPNVRQVIVRGSVPSTMSDAIAVEGWLEAVGGRPPLNPHAALPA